jgi:hypothetical protein
MQTVGASFPLPRIMIYAIATHLELPGAILMLVHWLLPNKRAQIPQVQLQGETHPRGQLRMIPNIIARTSVGVNQDAGIDGWNSGLR